ncbi:hypothetical protein [Anaerosinus gibii]|uniref:Uncharacterized protein n=1 Tax=Selenobaculum gibii TaxID=3054208 RepID=A0A9Y2ES22_9FIRM|nr:hypothetical protein [Selenobaculum gbiensis]WIW69856.1 hypothetical protein P3F81_07980 [Selenobaculum gbiensis]
MKVRSLKIVAFSVVLIFTMSFIAGCGSSANNEDKKQTPVEKRQHVEGEKYDQGAGIGKIGGK